MTIDLESSASSFLDDLDFDESDVAFLEQVTSSSTSDSGLHNSSSTILDELDEEMFSSTLQEDEDDEDLGLREERLPSLFNSAARRNSLLSDDLDGDRSHPAPSKRSSLVTPEPPAEDSAAATFPDPHELQRQYQHTLRKLAKSMRRSDATRSIVKRQKSLTFKSVASAVREGRRASMYNFFQSERCKELEESRRQLLRFINI